MKIETQQKSDVVVVRIEGRFDAFGVPEAEQHFQAAIEQQPRHLVINLGGVNFIDSTALAALVRALKRVREHQRDLSLCNLQQAVQIIFELTRLDKAFSLYADEATALTALGVK